MVMNDEERKKAETRAKLKAFLQSGDSEDVASILVHTLMHQAEKAAAKPEPKGPKSPRKPRKKK